MTRATKNKAFSFTQQDSDNLDMLVTALQERSIGSVTSIDALRYAMVTALQSLGLASAGKPLTKTQMRIPSEVVRPAPPVRPAASSPLPESYQDDDIPDRPTASTRFNRPLFNDNRSITKPAPKPGK